MDLESTKTLIPCLPMSKSMHYMRQPQGLMHPAQMGTWIPIQVMQVLPHRTHVTGAKNKRCAATGVWRSALAATRSAMPVKFMASNRRCFYAS